MIRGVRAARALGLAAAASAAAVVAGPAAAGDRISIDGAKTGDSSYAVTLETELRAGWTARAGMDMSLSGSGIDTRPSTVDPANVAALTRPDDPNTVAWSTLTVPTPGWLLGGQATFRAQVDPNANAAVISGTHTRSRALGQTLSASTSGNLIFTETGIGTAAGAHSWEANRTLRLEVEPTGTALVARGQVLGTGAASEPELNTYLEAEQPLGRGLGLTTSLGEIETGAPVLNIGAHFTRRW